MAPDVRGKRDVRPSSYGSQSVLLPRKYYHATNSQAVVALFELLLPPNELHYHPTESSPNSYLIRGVSSGTDCNVCLAGVTWRVTAWKYAQDCAWILPPHLKLRRHLKCWILPCKFSITSDAYSMQATDIANYEQMTDGERLMLAEELLSSLRNLSELPPPPQHGLELERRWQEFQANPAIGLSKDQFWAQVNALLR
ncbi:MAG: addiction module protein [Verrucomicrobiota bacterium]